MRACFALTASLIAALASACTVERKSGEIDPSDVPSAAALQCEMGDLLSWDGNGWLCTPPPVVDPPAARPLPYRFRDRMLVRAASASAIIVGPGRCRDRDDTFNIVLEAEDMADLVDSTDTDATAESANTWYFAWVIADSTGQNATRAFLSAASESPTLPAGYDKARLLGAARNDTASDFVPFAQSWPTLFVTQKDLLIYNAAPVAAAANVLVAANGAVPPGTQSAKVRIHNAQAAPSVVTIHTPGVPGVDSLYYLGQFPDSVGRLVTSVPIGGPLRDEEIRWSRNTGAGLNITVHGYEWGPQEP